MTPVHPEFKDLRLHQTTTHNKWGCWGGGMLQDLAPLQHLVPCHALALPVVAEMLSLRKEVKNSPCQMLTQTTYSMFALQLM
jgi:hypothetical protein